jgi:hypothetical protein
MIDIHQTWTPPSTFDQTKEKPSIVHVPKTPAGGPEGRCATARAQIIKAYSCKKMKLC